MIVLLFISTKKKRSFAFVLLDIFVVILRSTRAIDRLHRVIEL